MFIHKLFEESVKAIENERDPVFRNENIAWPSESLANVGDFAVGECRRALFYKIIGIPYTDKISVRVKRIGEIGSRIEDILINKFKEKNMYVSSQDRIEFEMPNTINKVKHSGKLDVIINDDNVIRGIEIKSISGFKVDKVFGSKNGMPLPSANNLMQAMNYKYHAMNSEINGVNVEEIYLMYVDRGSETTMYFKVDLDSEGWPIITPITMEGYVLDTIKLKDVPSYDDLLRHSTVATSTQSTLAELRINVNDIFDKFDSTYSYVREEILPPCDYSMIYSSEELEKQLHCGRLSKIKYNKHKKGDTCGDMRCSFCNYRTKCLADSGIRLS